MNGYNLLRVLLAVVLIAAIAGAGFYVYNIGRVQGRAEGAQLSSPEPGGLAYPPYGYWPGFRPFGFGFGLFGLFFLLIPILFLTRFLFWRPRGGWGGHYYGGDREVPGRFEEWHRKLHEHDREEG